MGTDQANGVLQRARDILSKLSGYEPAELDPTVSFMELGFDSLLLTQVSQSMSKAFGVPISFRQLMEALPTLAAVIHHVEEARPELAQAPPPSPGSPATATTTQASLPAPAGSMAALFDAQLQVMAQQLQMLGGGAAQQPPAFEPSEAAADEAASVARAKEARRSTPSAVGPSGGGHLHGRKLGKRVRGPEDLDATQRAALAEFIDAYTRRTRGSKARTQAHRAVHADPRTAAGFHPAWKEIVYPLVVERSAGSKLYDVDGNEYIDLLNGFGPNMLGYQDEIIVEAVRKQLDLGFEIGPMTPLAGEAAEMFCQLTGLDRCSFVCTGSEAVMAAVRCARTFTCRDKIVFFEGAYHGNTDEVISRAAHASHQLRTVPAAPGIPPSKVENALILEYGADASLEIIAERAHELAAVLVEPVQSRRPELQPGEFLRSLRKITEEHDTLLIFDEVVTGFRCGPGGAQAHFGVQADLATYGKVVGGGMPLGVVGGKKAVMDTFDGGFWQYGDDSTPEAGVTFLAGTFVRHPLAMAATHAMLRHLIDEGPELQARLARRTADLALRINAIFEHQDVPYELPHFTSIMFLRRIGNDDLSRLLFWMLRHHGVHVQGGFPSYLTTAHSDADLDAIVEAFAASVEAMLDAGFLARRAKPMAATTGPGSVPPVPGARLGLDPDGRPAWYVADPDKPEKFLRIG